MMDGLDTQARATIKQCLNAAARGPFFPDWEFQTLFGVDRQTVLAVHDAWPRQTVDDEDFRSAIIGSLNNLLGYPHQRDDCWSDYITASPLEVKRILEVLVKERRNTNATHRDI
jgi:hypothetical protein